MENNSVRMKKRVKKSQIDVEFPGYDHHNAQTQYFKYPMELEEYWWALSGSEQKVLDFIIRKTFGWQQQGDYISISQITGGEGKGTGLSRSQVKRAINSLEEKKFITVKRYSKKESYIELPLRYDVPETIDAFDVKRLRKEYNADYMSGLKNGNSEWVL